MSASIGKDIVLAQRLLQEGQLVAIPTETVYGLAANALDEKSVAKIFQAKNRPTFDPLIIHTDNTDKLKDWVLDFPDWASLLAQHFWPGALTMLLPKKAIIPDLTTSGLDKVAVRIPNHPLTLELLKKLDFPLAAPSANPFGYISPTTAAHVQAQLGDKIAYILDGGACRIGVESTIIGEENRQLTVFRKGGIAIEELETVIGKVVLKEHSNSNPNAPGMLASHYAPKVKLRLGNIAQLIQEYKPHEVGILSFENTFDDVPISQQFVLSPQGNFAEAAQNLFSYLRELDQLPIKIILGELLPEQDLGRAINDRLRRAAF